MRYTFASEAANAEALPTRKPAQYFEMFGHRGIWSEGWKAVTYHRTRNNLDDTFGNSITWTKTSLNAMTSQSRTLKNSLR